MPVLSKQKTEQYDREGYIVVENLLPAEEVTNLRNRFREYTHGDRPHGKIRFQLEPGVANGENKTSVIRDSYRKADGLVEHDELFRRLGTHPNIVDVVEELIGSDLKMFRNALLVKPPKIGSAKCMHQDSPYWPIEPMSLCSCWFAIDDATPENGCMSVLPGLHKKGAIPHHTLPEYNDFGIAESDVDLDDLLIVPMTAGSGLFFHSLLPHATAPNHSSNYRRAIALSYMSAKSKYTGKGESPAYFHIRGRSYEDCVK